MILAAMSVVLMIEDNNSRLESVHRALNDIIYPVQYLIDLPVRFTAWVDVNLTGYRNLIDENDQLRQQQLLYQLKLQKLDVLESENRRLREMLSSAPKVEGRVLVAELLAVDIDPYKQQITINKGERDGVYPGQAIIDARGVMGQVIHVSSHSSSAILISDPSHALPVQLNRNGLRSTVFGVGKPDELELRFIPHNSDIEVGDLVVTSGLGGRFPPGYPVARVITVDRPPGKPFSRVLAKPLALLDQGREVLLVWRDSQQIDSLGDENSTEQELSNVP